MTLVDKHLLNAALAERDAAREENARLRAEFVAALRFLAAARKEYDHLPADADMHGMRPAELAVREEHLTATWLADIFDGINDAKGWLPSWRWDEWPPIRAALAVPTTDDGAERGAR